MASCVWCLRLNSHNIQAAPSDSKKFRLVNATRLCPTCQAVVRAWKGGGRVALSIWPRKKQSPDVASKHRDWSATQENIGGGIF